MNFSLVKHFQGKETKMLAYVNFSLVCVCVVRVLVLFVFVSVWFVFVLFVFVFLLSHENGHSNLKEVTIKLLQT